MTCNFILLGRADWGAEARGHSTTVDGQEGEVQVIVRVRDRRREHLSERRQLKHDARVECLTL